MVIGTYTLEGYNCIWIFDNFGNLVSYEVNFGTLKCINDYLFSMEKLNCTRTLYYTDILACTEKDRMKLESAIVEYKNEWINMPEKNQ